MAIGPSEIGAGLAILGVAISYGAVKQQVRDVRATVDAMNPHQPPCKELQSYQLKVTEEMGEVRGDIKMILQSVTYIETKIRNGDR